MAGSTQAHEVFVSMGAAIGKRNDVVDFISGHQFTQFLALLAERVSGYAPVTDTLPCPTVAFACSRVALVFVVPRVHFFLVRGAISAAHQRRAARITARAFGFLWHDSPSFTKENPHGSVRMG